MEPAGQLHLRSQIWLAVTLVTLALGFAAVSWEWRNVHTTAQKHGRSARPQPAGAQNHAPPRTIAEQRE